MCLAILAKETVVLAELGNSTALFGDQICLAFKAPEPRCYNRRRTNSKFRPACVTERRHAKRGYSRFAALFWQAFVMQCVTKWRTVVTHYVQECVDDHFEERRRR